MPLNSSVQRWAFVLPALAVFGLALLDTHAFTQGKDAGKSSSSDKRITFEVFSMRPSARGTHEDQPIITPDGFSVTGVTMFELIEMAYNPMVHRRYWDSKNVLHLPAWANQEQYDIRARVADADVAAWQAHTDSNPETLNFTDTLRGALQAALKDRCGLAVTVRPLQVPALILTAGPHGAKLKESPPGGFERVAGGGMPSAIGDGGFYYDSDGSRHYRDVVMKGFVNYLMRFSEGALIADKTGLEGRYDFDLPYYATTGTSDNDPGTPLDRININLIGLRLRPGKTESYLFDIESLRRPDAN